MELKQCRFKKLKRPGSDPILNQREIFLFVSQKKSSLKSIFGEVNQVISTTRILRSNQNSSRILIFRQEFIVYTSKLCPN